MAEFGDRNVFRDVDRSYRRGLVLGLTFAELFLLLVFLLLMALAGTALHWWEEIQKTDVLEASNEQISEKLKAAEEELMALSEIGKRLSDSGLSPEQITTLIASERERLFSQQELARINEENKRIQEEAEEMKRQIDYLRPLAELGTQANAREAALKEALEKLEQLSSERESMQALADIGREFKEWSSPGFVDS
ncbi:hypothetical protein [Oceanibacterium hippocampi]|uniref:Chromosome partition protein Smc n=1 Tax=Oceanibacterium hippocampi TaxID=745714 RepID=A0A1Y5U070_9PROT|nr:hypothetical protein [Oceanibacterium hippocampi]SLN77883.1 hypothetical protein OCH7691_04584 [Oceanibacterium hippocampi]